MRSSRCTLHDALKEVYLVKNPKSFQDLQPLREAWGKASAEIYSRYPDMECPVTEASDLPIDIQIGIAEKAGV